VEDHDPKYDKDREYSDPDEVLGRVQAVDDLVPADLMVEAVIEDAAVKEDVFARADALLPPGAILASNTSSLSVSEMGEVQWKAPGLERSPAVKRTNSVGLSTSSDPSVKTAKPAMYSCLRPKMSARRPTTGTRAVVISRYPSSTHMMVRKLALSPVRTSGSAMISEEPCSAASNAPTVVTESATHS